MCSYIFGVESFEFRITCKLYFIDVILRPGFIYGTRRVGSMKLPLGVIGSPLEMVCILWLNSWSNLISGSNNEYLSMEIFSFGLDGLCWVTSQLVLEANLVYTGQTISLCNLFCKKKNICIKLIFSK